jgi:polyphosphate kinase 2
MAKGVPGRRYRDELNRLQVELVAMQQWVRSEGARLAVVFEGRDAAGKGGTIARILQHLNPRFARVVALAPPTERERTQWYFQRYIAHLPAAGEIVLFDRSWYNRAGVEYVLGFCTHDQHQRFLRQCPQFERMLIEEGIILVKYWFSVSDDEQERRFQARLTDPLKRWKLSPVDLEARERWVEFSRAKDTMFVHTDIPESRWWVVDGDHKKRARINCLSHLLSVVPYRPVPTDAVVLPARQDDEGYVRPSQDGYAFVPDRAAELVGAPSSE